MDISFIIPVYNGEKTLGRAVDSVFSHMPAFTELVIIDDGSTDGTAALCEQLQARHGDRVIYARQENRGPAAARNHGLRMVRSEWLWLLDSDDELAPRAGEHFEQLIHRHPSADVVMGAYMTGNGKNSHRQLPGKIAEDPVQRMRDFLVKKNLRPVHGSMVVNRRLLDQLVYREDMPQSEDIPVFARLLLNQNVVTTEHVLSVLHRSRGSLRNDPTHVQANIDRLVEEVFSIPNLPPEIEDLRPEYTASRCLSAARILLRAGRKQSARQCFRRAVRTRPAVLFRFRALRFLLRAYLP